MAYLVMLILDDPEKTHDVLDAWEAAGVRGVTLMESTGLGRVRLAGLRDDMPLIPSLMDLLRGEETHNQTMFSVVESEEKVDSLVKACQSVVGDFNQPNTGLLMVIPLAQVYGLHKKRVNH